MQWLDSPQGESANKLIAELLGILQLPSVDPAAVTLVLAGEFTASVQCRLDAGADAYTTDRLGGMVGAKTMPRADGSIDVIVPAALVLSLNDPDEAERALREHLLLYTVEHEAQHVGMRQRGEALHDAGRPLGRGQAHIYLCASAGVVLEEHRAELVAATRRPPANPHWQSVPDHLARLVEAFRDAVELRYPGESMDRPMATSFGAAHDAWVVAAYMAANQRAGGDIGAVPPELQADLLWQEDVAPHWQAFSAWCSGVPAGDDSVDRATLEAVLIELADLQSKWFVTTGFGLHDVPAGMYFDVHRHDF